MVPLDWLELTGSAAAGATLAVAILRYVFNPHIEDTIVHTIGKNEDKITGYINEWYKPRFAEFEEGLESVRRNAHSITGLRGIVTLHEEQLKNIIQMQPILTRQTEILDDLTTNLAEMNRELYKQGKELSMLYGLMERRLKARDGSRDD